MENERWIRLTLARGDGTTGDELLVKTGIIALVGPLTDENAQKFPRAKCAVTLLSGNSLLVEEATVEIQAMLAGGH